MLYWKIIVGTLVVFLTVLGLQTPVWAYETKVETRAFSAKLPSDNGVVIELHSLTLNGSPGKGPIWYMSEVVNGEYFKIEATHTSVALLRSSPSIPGLAPDLRFTSLDKLHGDWRYHVQTDPYAIWPWTYKMKVYFTADFMWVELSRQTAYSTPVNSTVFFVGPPPEVVDYYLNNIFWTQNVRYFNYDELKSDVQTNYADKYIPGGNNSRLEFSSADMDELLGTVNRFWGLD